jgi:GNAT superfamily N-acetyltransferase
MIRKARVLDSGRVGAILSEFIDTTDWIPRVHSRAEDISFAGDMIDRGWVDVFWADAFEDTKIAGFIARDETIIHALYVTSSTRQKGIGKALLDHAKSVSSELTLWTFLANENAQRFYKTAGFSEIERTDGGGNDEKLPDIRLYWKR